jgi:DNA repair exonuclease SbcCD ATPase subunit
MPPTGSLKNLTEHLKEKTQQDRQQIENIVSDELTTLRQSLNDATRNALSTIKSDMEREIRNAREALKEQTKVLSLSLAQRWLTASLMALAILLGLAVGGLGLAKLAERKARSLHQEITQLQQQQAKLESTVKQLQDQTWSLELLETSDGRFIILPPKATPRTGG